MSKTFLFDKFLFIDFLLNDVLGVRTNFGRVPQGHVVPSDVPRRCIRRRVAVPAVHRPVAVRAGGARR